MTPKEIVHSVLRAPLEDGRLDEILYDAKSMNHVDSIELSIRLILLLNNLVTDKKNSYLKRLKLNSHDTL